MVITTRGIVATAQTLASQAGAQALARGGSAADAAIVANAVLSVVEPMMDGPGGDLFALIWEAKTGKLHAINASGWAPRALNIEFFEKQNIRVMPSQGIHTMTVPGCVDGWEKLHQRFGKLPWNELFLPAIYYADAGFPVTELIQFEWDEARNCLLDDSRGVYLVRGAPPQVGEIFRNPALAGAFRLIAERGARAVYDGPIGEAILRTSKRYGGTMAPDDLRDFESEWVEPISTDYRGWTVSQLPPNGQGIGTLEMLNILENFPVGEHPQASAEALHWKIEAQKLATQDIKRYVGDPRCGPVPVRGLLSKDYAKQRAKLIDRGKAACEVAPGQPGDGHGNTTYLATCDSDGNVVSLIQSISNFFGCGLVADGMGFMLHDRGGGFVLDRNHLNSVAGRKRPFHTIIPGFMQRGSQHIAFGIMRGMNQAQAQMQLVTHIADHGMNMQAALEAPRFTRIELGGCGVHIETRVPEAELVELTRRGHELRVVGEYSGYMGGGQVILHDSEAKVNYGASSPRKDGAAIPEPDPYFR